MMIITFSVEYCHHESLGFVVSSKL
ncbi:BnaC03g55070D [Brassica napus]|uniref:BnaC03g55070D protein n=1 Tax=Brassica napus TaxID=3708 RepID=A0A078H2H8_BRANA|nr:BnaC03g55070D [Brassica napus]